MTEQFYEFVERYVIEKIKENSKIIRCSFYELKVKLNLTDEQIDDFLKISKEILENMRYNVYFTGAKFKYENANRTVQDNEFMIAVKE